MNRHEKSRIEWKKRIEEWQASGISGQKWSAEHQLSYHTFLYWRSKFSKKTEKSPLSFIELSDSSSQGTPIELVISDVTIKINKGFDPLTLKSCLELVRSLPC